MNRARRMQTALLLVVVASSTACSVARNRYRFEGYTPVDEGGIKHIAVRAWGPADAPDVAPTLALVTARMVNQYTNYLVHSQDVLSVGWAEACGEQQGVLVVRALRVERGPGVTWLDLAVELYRCSDGALVWRVEGLDDLDPADEDLENLTASYVSDLGEGARPYIAPAFSLLQQLLEILPNPPPLTDEEIDQRIELEIELG